MLLGAIGLLSIHCIVYRLECFADNFVTHRRLLSGGPFSLLISSFMPLKGVQLQAVWKKTQKNLTIQEISDKTTNIKKLSPADLRQLFSFLRYRHFKWTRAAVIGIAYSRLVVGCVEGGGNKSSAGCRRPNSDKISFLASSSDCTVVQWWCYIWSTVVVIALKTTASISSLPISSPSRIPGPASSSSPPIPPMSPSSPTSWISSISRGVPNDLFDYWSDTHSSFSANPL